MTTTFTMVKNTIICPGCGKVYKDISSLPADGVCVCSYENGLPPYRLLTLGEMCDDDMEYDTVRMDLFLTSLFNELSSGANS